MVSENLHADLQHWLQDFEEAMADWEKWLLQCQTYYLQARFASLMELQDLGQTIVIRLQSLHRSRLQMIKAAQESGHAVHNLQELAVILDQEFQTRLTERVNRQHPKLRAMSQQNIALWLSMLQGEAHTASVLRIMATGLASTATYHPGEGESIGGGQLVDQAA